MDDDVIEIGEDGAFDIPSPEKVAPKVQPAHVSSKVKVESSNVDTDTISSEQILETVPKGEYKVFSNEKSREVHIVLHLLNEEAPSDIKLLSNELRVSFSEAKSFVIDVSSLGVDPTSAHATHWKDFLSFRFAKRSQ
mmetsp:Transcript_1696/g.2674  ORF Transcript_1696/g.2674 Transcript_1696/m.2674 type:complete len:137 (+) Transcript_1696:70-480(+)